MSFDPHSLKRLQELGRQLPKTLNTPQAHNTSNKNSPKNSKLHPVETEEDPKALFHELIKISPDGTIPAHLLSRLKNAELNQLNENEDIDSDLNIVELKKSISSNHQRKDKLSKKEQQKLKEDESLYSSFERLLLEEEDEI